MKPTVCKMEYTLGEIDSRLDVTEEKTSELAVTATEIIQNKIQGEKKENYTRLHICKLLRKNLKVLTTKKV